MKQISCSDRAHYLLTLLVERYIHEGQPVGSKTLAQESGLPVSPATIRNVMSDLEEQGFLVSPHTSAGRIPTDRGYRLYVDTLLESKPINAQQLQSLSGGLSKELDADKSPQQLVESASKLLSEVTSMTGLVMVPTRDAASLRQVEFLPLSGARVLVILVLNEKEVQNQIIHTEREYSESELQEAANFINARFAGKDLIRVRRELLTTMQNDKDEMSQLMQTALDVTAGLFDQEEESDSDAACVVSGEGNLLSMVDNNNIDKLRGLFDAFHQKRDILHLLDRCMKTDGVQIFIGGESGYAVFDECSLVTAPYQADGQQLGVLAVVGPTRMNYERIIPAVDMTAKILSAALNHA